MTAPRTWNYALTALLALTAGATDAISFLGLGGVFCSVMTANLVLLGLSAPEHSAGLAAHAASALAGYVAGALAAGRLLNAGGPGRINVTLAAEGLILAGFSAGWEIEGGRPSGWPQLVLLATAALAMGGQSATVIALKLPGVSATYMTGMLTGILGDLVTATREGLGFRLSLLGLLVIGAVASGLAFTEAPSLAPVVILAPMAGALTISLRQASQTR
jgi:uncharacterized membrane protein YoaK (UPF0700 family)